jgi:hypothetical protein
MGSNWENFLKNLGEWRGSFTKISQTGEVLDSTPSIISLEALDDNKLVRFRLRRFGSGSYEDTPTQDYEQDYTSLGRQIVFFDSGAFSKGSLQLAPFTEFGAEYGFVDKNRRARFVQLYDRESNLSSLTLIREFRAGTDAQERPPLTVDQLWGRWEGEACTCYPDWRSPETFQTTLEVKQLSPDQLWQQLTFAGQIITSTARIDGKRLLFEAGDTPRQILLLPDGISSNAPTQVKLRQPVLLEVGWLLAPHQRQRVIRSYNDKGEWISATFVVEQRVA